MALIFSDKSNFVITSDDLSILSFAEFTIYDLGLGKLVRCCMKLVGNGTFAHS